MRLFGRIFVVGAVATLPAVVALIGCVVDSDRPPGIGNDVPNSRGVVSHPSVSSSSSSGTGGTGTGGAGGAASSSSSSSSSTSSGATPNICECAAGFATAGACSTCAATAAAGPCSTEQMNCVNDPQCQLTLACVAACPQSNATCVEGCITGSTVYLAVAACQCQNCASACAPTTPLTCGIGADAGTDGGDGGP